MNVFMFIGVFSMVNMDRHDRLDSFLKRMKYPSIPPLEQALADLTDLLDPLEVKWLAGGSVGLWLQGVPLKAPPRDIDIYAEKEAAALIHTRLEAYAADLPRWDRSGIYASLLSHYTVNHYPVELVGGFEIHAPLARYNVEIEAFLDAAALEVIPGLKVMPLAHEYIFNLLRDRPDRYLAIKEHINRDPGETPSLLKEIACRNGWTPAQQSELNGLAPIRGWIHS